MNSAALSKRRTLLAPDERRAQLLQAAIHVFARKGYRTASISDIIEHAGVARGTFYLYFDSKQQVFLAIVEDFHGRVKSALEAAAAPAAVAASGPLDRSDDAQTGARALLEAGFRRWLAFFAAHRDQARVVLREASSIDPRFEKGYDDLRATAVSFFTARYRRFQELGVVRRTLAPELLAHLVVGMFDELLNAYILRDPGANLERLAAQLADFEWNGIRPR